MLSVFAPPVVAFMFHVQVNRYVVESNELHSKTVPHTSQDCSMDFCSTLVEQLHAALASIRIGERIVTFVRLLYYSAHH